MTINEVIDLLDQQKPNAYSEKQKRHWLSQFEDMAFREVIETHENGAEGFVKYDENTDGNTQLLLDDGFADVYVQWLCAMIDFANQETSRYTNDMIMFNARYRDWSAWYNRTHMPRTAFVRGAADRIRR